MGPKLTEHEKILRRDAPKNINTGDLKNRIRLLKCKQSIEIEFGVDISWPQVLKILMDRGGFQ